MTEPVKVLPMAKLLRLAREKEERERAERESAADLSEVAPADESPINSTIPQETILLETIVESTIPQETIVHKAIPRQINVEAGHPPDSIEDKTKFSSETKTKRKDKRAAPPCETIVH